VPQKAMPAFCICTKNDNKTSCYNYRNQLQEDKRISNDFNTVIGHMVTSLILLNLPLTPRTLLCSSPDFFHRQLPFSLLLKSLPPLRPCPFQHSSPSSFRQLVKFIFLLISHEDYFNHIFKAQEFRFVLRLSVSYDSQKHP
jgi:hypothetical protein